MFLSAVSSASFATPEVVVIGQRYSTNTFDHQFRAAGMSGNYYAMSAIMMQRAMQQYGPQIAAAKEAARIKQCIAKAAAAKQSCENAYEELAGFCQTFNGLLGGAAVATSRFFYTKITGMTINEAVSVGMSATGTAAGFSMDDTVVPCTQLTAQAMNFCAAGAEKMKNSC